MKKKFLTLLASLCCVTGAMGLAACGEESSSAVEEMGKDVSIEFTVDGVKISSSKANTTQTITLPVAPEKLGYDFAGWFLDEGVWNTPFTEDYFLKGEAKDVMSVYAKFDAIPYSIVFENVEDDELSEEDKTYTIEGKELAPLESDDREFQGWYMDGEEVTEIPEGMTGEITLEAKWTIDWSGTVFEAGADYDLSNSLPIDGVSIHLTGGNIDRTTTSDEEGNYSFGNLPLGEYTLTLTKDDFLVATIVITVDKHVNKDVYMDIDQESTISGIVLRADSDMNMANNERLEGATVNLVKKSGATPLSLTYTTDANGSYSFLDLTAGIYLLSISKEGYLSVEQYVMVQKGQNIVQNMALEVVEEPAPEAPTTGGASGFIYDAMQQGDNGVGGLTLKVREGINNIQGRVLLTLTTDEDGTYCIEDFESGNYTIEIIDERELADETQRCGSTYFNIKILAGQTIVNQNGQVFSEGATVSGELTVILTWGSSPSDLDSHLTGPTSGGSRYHIYFSNKSDSSAGTSNLDRDDTDSYGPETTTIDTTVDGVYRFSVHDWSNQNNSSSSGLKNSGAKVELYEGGRLVYTFYVPQELGTVWTVFEYDSTTGQITTINTIGNAIN